MHKVPHLRSLVVPFALLVVLVNCGTKSPNEPPPPACTYTLSPSTLSFDSSGGSASVTVTTAAQCAWTAASDRGWISITTGASSTGNGVVSVTVASNPNTDARTGTLTIAGQAVPVVQQAAAPVCSYEISPTSAAYSKDGGSGSFAVTAPSGCAWTATSSDAWIAVSPPAEPVGNGTVSYTVSRNTQIGGRTGTIVVAGRTFTVSQAGDAGLCEYAVSPVDFRPCMSAPYDLTATITTQAGCSWTANPDASWITVSAQSGSGPGVISFRVSDNWDAPRQGLVMVRWPTPTAGQNLRVAQAGCRYAVSTTSISMVAAGGTGRFDVFQQSDPYTCGGPLQNGCMWIAQSDVPWITVSTAPQFGDNPVSFTVAANEGATARTGTITVRDQAVRITQAGR